MDEELVVEIVVGLDNVNLAFYLLGNLNYLFLVAPCRDGILMYSLYARSRNVQTLYVDLLTGEHSGNLIQNTSYVFRVNQQCI